MASIPRVASNALLAALGIVVDALIVVETLPSETVEDRHTLSPAEAVRTLSRPLPTPLDPDTATVLVEVVIHTVGEQFQAWLAPWRLVAYPFESLWG